MNDLKCTARYTLKYLMTWERVHNPSVKVIHLDDLLLESMDNRVIISPKEWMKKPMPLE